jgi:putative addiction module component (TIGR02574 family)
MSPKLTELLTAAMGLSPAEREELADSLWASLDPPDAFDGMAEGEFAAELDRRATELKSDPSLGASWDEVRDMR